MDLHGSLIQSPAVVGREMPLNATVQVCSL